MATSNLLPRMANDSTTEMLYEVCNNKPYYFEDTLHTIYISSPQVVQLNICPVTLITMIVMILLCP